MSEVTRVSVIGKPNARTNSLNEGRKVREVDFLPESDVHLTRRPNFKPVPKPTQGVPQTPVKPEWSEIEEEIKLRSRAARHKTTVTSNKPETEELSSVIEYLLLKEDYETFSLEYTRRGECKTKVRTNKTSRGVNKLTLIFAILAALATGALIGLVWKTFILPVNVTVEGESMEPAYHDGQVVSVIPEPPTHQYQYGDVVITQEEPDKQVIKRIVGVPGDIITYKDGTLLRNGTPIAEMNPLPTVMEEGTRVAVGPGTYFLLGDNYAVSRDSRIMGVVGSNTVLGKVKQ